jgi:hypothetical protein
VRRRLNASAPPTQPVAPLSDQATLNQPPNAGGRSVAPGVLARCANGIQWGSAESASSPASRFSSAARRCLTVWISARNSSPRGRSPSTERSSRVSRDDSVQFGFDGLEAQKSCVEVRQCIVTEGIETHANSVDTLPERSAAVKNLLENPLQHFVRFVRHARDCTSVRLARSLALAIVAIAPGAFLLLPSGGRMRHSYSPLDGPMDCDARHSSSAQL